LARAIRSIVPGEPFLHGLAPPGLGFEHRSTRRALELNAVCHRGNDLPADLNLDLVCHEAPETIVRTRDRREGPIRARVPTGIGNPFLDQPTPDRRPEPPGFVRGRIDIDDHLNRVTHVV
jgi:hypothetical protein